MTLLYKLTTQDNLTRKGYDNETLWGENVTHSKPEVEEPSLCSKDVIHAYLSPELAVILNPIHSDIENPKLWIAEGDVVLAEGQLKVGCFSLTTLKEIPFPELTDTQRIAFAILCAKEVYKDQSFHDWADKWLSGEDRSRSSAKTAYATADATYAAAYYAARSADYYAYYAAYYAAANAYYAAANADYYATYATTTTTYAADAAYYAARSAHASSGDIDLIKIIEKVKKEF